MGILFNGVGHITNTKTRGSKYRIALVNKHFNCVTPVSVSLASSLANNDIDDLGDDSKT